MTKFKQPSKKGAKLTANTFFWWFFNNYEQTESGEYRVKMADIHRKLNVELDCKYISRGVIEGYLIDMGLWKTRDRYPIEYNIVSNTTLMFLRPV